MTQLVDPWYGDTPMFELTTDCDLIYDWCWQLGVSALCKIELSDAACMRLCGALESELV